MEIRKKQEIRAGDRVEILDFGDHIVMVPVKDVIRDAKGWLHSEQSVLQMLREARKEKRWLQE